MGNLLKTAPRRQTAQAASVLSLWFFRDRTRGSPTSWSLFSPNPRAPFCAGCMFIAGIAWIGSSFYFIHLDLSLKPRPGLPAGVKGDEWQVRGRRFLSMMKYLVAPAQISSRHDPQHHAH